MLFLIQETWEWRTRKDGHVLKSSMVSRGLHKLAGGVKRVKFYSVAGQGRKVTQCFSSKSVTDINTITSFSATHIYSKSYEMLGDLTTFGMI